MKILGHRGIVDKNNPSYQNTLSAFKIALEHCDGFECDATHTKDGDIFFIHDTQTTDKTYISLNEHLDEKSSNAAANRPLDEITTQEAQTYKTKKGETLPTLEETLSLFTNNPTKILNIELKAFDVETYLIPKMKKAFDKGTIKIEQVLFSSFNHPALAHLRKEIPNARIGMLFDGADEPELNLAPWRKDCKALYTPALKKNFKSPNFDLIKPETIIVPSYMVTNEFVEMFKAIQPNVQISMWVVTETESKPVETAKKLIQKFKDNENIHTIIIDTPHLI